MAKGNTRHMFPGGNTCKGFYSYYDHIMSQEQANRVFVVKGGPGTGKSTFMRRVADRFVKKGYDVEVMHCSSDPGSLDGVVVPGLHVAIMDGTAPHEVDPKNPGAIDETINLGEFWDTGKIERNREKIYGINLEIGKLFKRTYRYLAAAAHVYEDNSDIFRVAMDRQKAVMAANRIIKEHFEQDPVSEYGGGIRKLFATAVTPRGLRSFLPSILNVKKIVVLKSSPWNTTDEVISRIIEAARDRGFYTEVLYCGLFPEKPEHVVVPEKDLCVATSNKYHTVITTDRDVDDGENINLDEYLDNMTIEKEKDMIEYNRLEFEGLLNRAVMTLEQAKNLHDILEKYYIAGMDFDAVDECMERIIARMESMA